MSNKEKTIEVTYFQTMPGPANTSIADMFREMRENWLPIRVDTTVTLTFRVPDEAMESIADHVIDKLGPGTQFRLL